MKNAGSQNLKIGKIQKIKICDIVKNKNRIEQQVYIEGLQNYFLNGKPDLKKLARYAKKLGIQQKVMDVAMLYMKP